MTATALDDKESTIPIKSGENTPLAPAENPQDLSYSVVKSLAGDAVMLRSDQVIVEQIPSVSRQRFVAAAKILRPAARLIVSLACLLAMGCQELPRSGWPVVRGASPTADSGLSWNEEAESEGGLESDESPDSSPSYADRFPRFYSDGLDHPTSAWSGSSLINPERSGISFDEDPGAFGAPKDPEEPFGFGDQPASWGDPDEMPAEEAEREPFRFWEDVKATPGILWADAKSLVTWQNTLVLGAAAGAAIVIRDDVDKKVRQETAEHPSRWGEGSEVLRQFGEFSYQVPVLAGVYAAGLWTQDETLHEFSLSALSAYGLTAVTTVTIKGITNTQRPTNEFQDGHYGFPSYHSASTFSIAACLEEYYGWKVGLPAYVLAGLVGWSRIDQREHDLSDVLFGAVLGVVIGKTVSAAHLDRQSDIKIAPYYDLRNQGTGISVEKRY